MNPRSCRCLILGAAFVASGVFADQNVGQPLTNAPRVPRLVLPSSPSAENQIIHGGRNFAPPSIRRVSRRVLRQTEPLPWAPARPKVDLYDSRPYTPVLPPDFD